MSFGDTMRADEVGLRDRITVEHPDTGDWITGKVIELALLGDNWETVRITLITDTGFGVYINRTPDAPIIYEGVHRRD